MCTSVIWVLYGQAYIPGCDLLHRHPLLSREFTCTYSLKVLEGSNGRESSEELVHAIGFMLPRAHPNTNTQLVPLFYPILTPVPAVVSYHAYFSSGSRVSQERGPGASESHHSDFNESNGAFWWPIIRNF